MRTDCELELKQKLVGSRTVCVVDAAVLTANLTELAWKVGKDQRLSPVDKLFIVWTAASVISSPHVPAARELIVRGDKIASRILRSVWLTPAAPDKLRPRDEGVIHGSLQRLPPYCCIRTVKLSGETPGVGAIDEARRVMAVRNRESDIQVGIVGEVLIASEVSDICQIAALAGCDLLTISPDLLAELAANDAPLALALDAKAKPTQDIPRVMLNEADFRFALNEDAMATEKLAEGIRAFAADAVKLEKLMGF